MMKRTAQILVGIVFFIPFCLAQIGYVLIDNLEDWNEL